MANIMKYYAYFMIFGIICHFFNSIQSACFAVRHCDTNDARWQMRCSCRCGGWRLGLSAIARKAADSLGVGKGRLHKLQAALGLLLVRLHLMHAVVAHPLKGIGL